VELLAALRYVALVELREQVTLIALAVRVILELREAPVVLPVPLLYLAPSLVD
jgi:hypothetical protein